MTFNASKIIKNNDLLNVQSFHIFLEVCLTIPRRTKLNSSVVSICYWIPNLPYKARWRERLNVNIDKCNLAPTRDCLTYFNMNI